MKKAVFFLIQIFIFDRRNYEPVICAGKCDNEILQDIISSLPLNCEIYMFKYMLDGLVIIYYLTVLSGSDMMKRKRKVREKERQRGGF